MSRHAGYNLDRSLKLTEQEEQIKKLFVEGLSMPEIADRLSIKRNTIYNIISRIYTKLGVCTKEELIASGL